jgi:hypothetical protein
MSIELELSGDLRSAYVRRSDGFLIPGRLLVAETGAVRFEPREGLSLTSDEETSENASQEPTEVS